MAREIAPTQQSSLLQYLPAIFQQGTDEGGTAFLGRFLLAFEKVLSGLDDPDEPGLDEVLDRIHAFFDPDPDGGLAHRAPREFLPWLASWVALTLRDDWEEDERRRFISRIVPVYRQRGTKAGIAEALRAYTGLEGVEVSEFQVPMQIGVTSTLGEDTMLGGGPPHYFTVKINLGTPDPLALTRKTRITRAIIDQEKPAHTYYDLYVEVPTMQIGVYSTVGVDTLLGTPQE